MIILEERNHFYELAVRLNFDLGLSGQELVFESEEDCINHHTHNRY